MSRPGGIPVSRASLRHLELPQYKRDSDSPLKLSWYHLGSRCECVAVVFPACRCCDTGDGGGMRIFGYKQQKYPPPPTYTRSLDTLFVAHNKNPTNNTAH
jgi:hypothetical protein